jgi:hypothetical protein
MNPRIVSVLREELWRGFSWFGLALFGWSMAITGTDRLPANAYTVLGLPLLTALGLSIVLALVRLTHQ